MKPIAMNSYVGLTKLEARVWATLTEFGSLDVTAIADMAKMSRPSVYRCLKMFEENRLVKTLKKSKRTLYAICSPLALSEWYTSRISSKKKQALKKRELDSDIVEVFRGKDIAKIWEMVLEEQPKKSVFFRYDGYSPETPVNAYMPKGFYAAMERQKLERFVITNGRLRKSAYKKKVECASRMLPMEFDAFEQGVCQFILQDSLAMIDFTQEIAVVIRNKALADYQRRVFQFLYSILEV